MIKKAKVKKSEGTSGGAAAAGGMNFQERVAALALVHFLIGSDDLFSISPEAVVEFQSLHMETTHAIDDVVLLGKEFRLLIQAKRKLDFSESPASDFSAVIAQFVRHHLAARLKGDRYLLATSIRSSDRIVFTLRELTESARLNSTALAIDPLNEVQKSVLERTRRLISHHIQTLRPGAVMADEVDDLLRSIWVLPLDLDSGCRDEATALALLRSRSLVEPRLIWNSLLELTATLTQRRSSVDRQGLEVKFSPYLKTTGEKKTVEDEFRLEMEQRNDFSSGKEIVIFDRFMGTEDISVCEFRRFAEDGGRRLSFAGNQCTWPGSSSQTVVYRSATWERAARFLEANAAAFAERKIVLMPSNGGEDPNESPWAQAHSAVLKNYLKANPRWHNCLICSDPVSEDKALVIEVDQQEHEPAVGCIHSRCYRPSLRVLGEVRSDLFNQFPGLVDFDYEEWVLANKHGPSLVSSSPGEGIRYAGWTGKTTGTPRGSWCVRIDLEDGGISYLVERGKVVRKSQTEAIAISDQMTMSFEQAIAQKDPWCYTSDRGAFGLYSVLGSWLKIGQRLLRCVNASAVQFTAAIDITYSTKRNHYTPLLQLLDRESGLPVEILGTVPLISDPFDLSTYITNWQEAGETMPTYSVHALVTDRDFDDVVESCHTRGQRVVIDPFYDLHGNPLRGLVIRAFEDLAEQRNS